MNVGVIQKSKWHLEQTEKCSARSSYNRDSIVLGLSIIAGPVHQFPYTVSIQNRQVKQQETIITALVCLYVENNIPRSC